MSFVAQILDYAAVHPNKTAIQNRAQGITYGELAREVRSTAGRLHSMGVEQNRGVLVHASNTYAFVCTYLAVHYLGARCMPIDPHASVEFIQYITDKGQPCCVVSNPDHLLAADCGPIDSDVCTEKDAIADIVFTSGTTGEPKGVIITHQQLLDATLHIIREVGNTECDRELLLMPLCHSFGLGRMRSTLLVGATLVIGYPLNRLKGVFTAMKDHNVTGLGLVPAAWEFITSLSHDVISRYANQLSYIELGSAVLSPKHKRTMRDWFPTTRILMHYGLTEVSRAIFSRIHSDPDMSVGKLGTGAEVWILDAENHPVQDGVEGEIALRAPWMMDQYLENRQLTETCFVDGMFKTGDLGLIENGHVYLKGRIKEIINVGGKKVNPGDVEAVLMRDPSVFDCACVAESDSHAGEVVKAFLVLNTNQVLDEDKLARRVRDHLPSYMWPRSYEVCTAIPRTSAGKIQRLKLLH